MNRYCLFILVAVSLQVYAADSLSTKILNQYNSLRALGMGNAFTAVANDYSAIFYNPAALAKRKNGEIQFTFAGAGVSEETTKFITDISDASKSATTDSAKAQAISDALEPYYGVPLGGRVQALEFFWARPNWEFALIPLDLSVDIGVHRQLGPAIDLNLRKDTTLAYAYGQNLTDTLAGGITVKFVHRDAVTQAVSALELASDPDILSSKRFSEGTNLDFDLGFMWTPHWFRKNVEKEAADDELPKTKVKKRTIQSETISSEDAALLHDDSLSGVEAVPVPEPEKKIEPVKSPQKKVNTVAKKKKSTVKHNKADNDEQRDPLSFSFVVRNVIGSSFTKSNLINKDATDAPAKNNRVIDIGSNYEFMQLGGLTLRTTLDFRNLLHPEASFKKCTHAGIEMDYSPNGWFKTQLRAGISQMYFTAGATFLFGVLEIDAVTYGEEVGTTSENTVNRVTALKVGMNF